MQPATAADQHGHKGSNPWEMRFVTKEAPQKNRTERQERALVQKHNKNNQEEKKTAAAGCHGAVGHDAKLL